MQATEIQQAAVRILKNDLGFIISQYPGIQTDGTRAKVDMGKVNLHLYPLDNARDLFIKESSAAELLGCANAHNVTRGVKQTEYGMLGWYLTVSN